MVMARTKAQLSAGARVADYLTVGYLAMRCPIGKVRETLARYGVESQRRRGLPHEALVCFVLAMVLYANVAYEEVLRLVVEGLRPPLGDEGLAQSTVSKGAISQARARVGAGSPPWIAGDGRGVVLGPADHGHRRLHAGYAG